MHVTVCICTRNRGERIALTLRSLQRSRTSDFDVVIVDQSDDDDTERAVNRCALEGLRIKYIRSAVAGLSHARNACVDNASGPIVAFTDDDCEVDRNWMNVLIDNFAAHPEVGLICGAVVAGPHDATRGFIPDYRVSARRQISSPWQKWREGGIGANLAFRLDVLRAVGPFDEILGAGGPLHTCEDGDMTYRVLKAGYSVLELPDALVTHHGFRDWAEGQRMMPRTGMGVGAAYMKHLRMGDVAVLPTLLVEWARCISWRRLILLQPHSGLRRFLGYARGMVLCFRYPIDMRRGTFTMRAEADPRAHRIR